MNVCRVTRETIIQVEAKDSNFNKNYGCKFPLILRIMFITTSCIFGQLEFIIDRFQQNL